MSSREYVTWLITDMYQMAGKTAPDIEIPEFTTKAELLGFLVNALLMGKLTSGISRYVWFNGEFQIPEEGRFIHPIEGGRWEFRMVDGMCREFFGRATAESFLRVVEPVAEESEVIKEFITRFRREVDVWCAERMGTATA